VIALGEKAPDFRAQTSDGRTLVLHELRGRPVVLYFFPKAFTPG
jgi:peroxiredoxin Q/BCP